MLMWIWELENQVRKYGSIDNLIAKLKSLDVSDVCIKYHEGSSPIGGEINFKADFLSYASNFKKTGFKVGTWGYNYFNDVQTEANLIIEALNNSDYYIYDPEVDVSNKFAQAEQVCQLVRKAHPNAVIGYSSFSIVSLHQDIPYSVFNQYCDFASPQCYWGEMQWSINNCIDEMVADYKTYGLDKPIYPSIQTYNINYNDFVAYAGYKFNNTGLWSFDELDSTCTNFLINSDFIKSVQHDLQRVSCLATGEFNATGILDTNTKAAIKQFRSIVGLPASENIDNQLTNALNIITKKPIIGPGWPAIAVATKFIQWWIGAPKTGVFDEATTQMVKSWQKATKIYWDPDGVIREESWIKILK